MLPLLLLVRANAGIWRWIPGLFLFGVGAGTMLTSSVLVAVALPEGKPFAVAMVMMIVFTLIGLVLGVLIPRQPVETARPAESSTTAAR